ncbi:hypothetical protein B879_01220 [Cecembia lonarensis LW9]|uniref:Uncharacterized protein n=1 Tax=Cecembia lonarensis (strain CCUG 58316 / KCTC 22772 / LW9) TaxID=1225176 RepID=K1M1P1_CECL9|nr:hypothetical protein B879_01220 [Cecembia lonarensis LW9]
MVETGQTNKVVFVRINFLLGGSTPKVMSEIHDNRGKKPYSLI